jgi:hypothetical protein
MSTFQCLRAVLADGSPFLGFRTSNRDVRRVPAEASCTAKFQLAVNKQA